MPAPDEAEMATLNAANYATTNNAPVGALCKGAEVVNYAVIAVPASGAGTALNDTLGFLTIPRGAILTGLDLAADQLETSGSPTLTIDLGYAGSTQAFAAAWAGTSAAVTAAVSPNKITLAAGLIGFQFTADTQIFATIHAAATTKKAGNLALVVRYSMGGLPS